MKNRISSFDIARTFAILITYVAHIVAFQAPDLPLTTGLLIFSPGATMAILGFISSSLIASRGSEWSSKELTRRIIRIYIPMFLCTAASFVLGQFHHISYDIKQVVLHLLGLSLFMDWFNVPNNATIGYGLWYVTAILTMYLTLPIQVVLFRHRNGLVHFVGYSMLCMLLRQFLPSDTSFWTVAVSFGFGVYLVVNGKLSSIIECSAHKVAPLTFLVLVGSYLALTLPNYNWILGFIIPFYPLALMPFVTSLADKLPRSLNMAAAWFSEISYEFFIIQFALFNGPLWNLVGKQSLLIHILTSFTMTIFIAFALNRLGKAIRLAIENYLVLKEKPS